MRYIPLTDADARAMLEAVGARSTAEILGSQIPAAVRMDGLPPIDPPLAELELRALAESVAAKAPSSLVSFLGAGSYDHFTPAVIEHLVTRGEFATAYTPYQPEIAQGTLMGAYEFQSYMAMLTGMEVANSSMYDASTAAAEALLMAHRLTRRGRVLLSGALHPHHADTIRTFVSPLPQIQLETVPVDPSSGRTDTARLAARVREAGDVACVIVQGPNVFGVIEDWREVSRAVADTGALFVAVLGDPLSAAIIAPPGSFGADIVVGDAQGLGLPPYFGGPNVGIFCCKNSYVRQMPGRLAGETVDEEGRRGYVLTLTTREQFIRREKATSNICTSQQLCALWVTVYCSLYGRQGLQDLARHNLALAEDLKRRLAAIPGVSLPFTGPTFNEFTVRLPVPAAGIIRRAADKAIAPGVDLGTLAGPAHANDLLVCTTEQHQRFHHDALVEFIREAAR